MARTFREIARFDHGSWSRRLERCNENPELYRITYWGNATGPNAFNARPSDWTKEELFAMLSQATQSGEF